MENLAIIVDKLLPLSASKKTISYNANSNMLVTSGYTSVAGNTYFNGIRLSDRIFIVLDIGIGYAHTFLNGICIYSNSGEQKKVIAKKSYSSVYYNEEKVKTDAIELIKKELENEMKKNALEIDDASLNEFVYTLVEDAYKNQIDNLKSMQLNKLLEK